LSPGDLLFALAQVLVPEVVQLQLPPQLTAQPAVAEGPRPPENYLVHANLDGIDRVGRQNPVVGEQAHGLRWLPAFPYDRKRLAPGRLLGVVDLAQIEHLTLEPRRAGAAGQPSALHHAEVAMLLAVLSPLACLQVHAGDDPAWQRSLQWSGSTLHGF
jgi:hypothetical protein